MGVSENIKSLLINDIPKNVKLIAVTKTKPISAILEAYNSGYKIFGENKVQELSDKYQALPKDIEWHMIGHLQTNKVKYIAPFVHLIHGVDSFKLLQVIDKEGQKNNRKINCLLQFYIAKEETKFGFDLPEALHMIQLPEFNDLKNVNIVGVMGMATFTENTHTIRAEFKELVYIFNQLKNTFFQDNPDFKEISMGMSNDYKLAIEEGATLVRIGSLIFGERNII
ncbi:MAG: YggS family pyridoxal phosphate enzyme [Bacteroidetes bacterium GWC2_33_15]|nr:MAG: YggS family pyridoxal phosphate enzyme [Bacteroidetes bacterium GWA2_33_15]OFX49665.1 MAG: YggS family pyridoxal phosphate enzyme [Bacteroidetes bacterium GWC2_33_15]OFX65945.1 MAG: YggS family pyridoxal phosphate enzyme [Bacteroidetes bacterium GWB2_32_14]OFX68294.1 MAG: YggS family pyridoxal phosphate enzyme [Bacteroidetes bacterium GWD2_33_33]HAN18077.1 YggS family pyridoxal phosphate-dependent enzyme [Bacteroidales bacterium]